MSPYVFVQQFEALMQAGVHLPLKHALPPRSAQPSGKCCIILSPHPDDECIVGALPLRLVREGGWRVVNVAVTHGSNPARQLTRADELKGACEVLGFENVLLAERGLLRISADSRSNDPAHWAACVKLVAKQLLELKPDLILCPHPQDAQAAHIGTHLLALDALAAMPAEVMPLVAFTEYWSTMASPNWMVQVSAQDLGDLMAALMQHAGEVSRNPYHLSLPAWMMDNVRRGAEQVGMSGSLAPPFTFATLYRVMQWRDGVLSPAWQDGRFAPCTKAISFDLSKPPG
jgi:LmbE family N-acetylglucosaminyl deacetylase